MTESQKNFSKAVKMAKAFTGDWIACMKLALKIVWKQAKKAARSLVDWVKRMNENMTNEELYCKVWEGYGKRRVYVNRRGFRKAVGYFNFNADGEYVNSFGNFSAIDGGPRVAAFESLKSALENNNL